MTSLYSPSTNEVVIFTLHKRRRHIHPIGGVFIDAGSRYETVENNGVAHFLAHLIFKVLLYNMKYKRRRYIHPPQKTIDYIVYV